MKTLKELGDEINVINRANGWNVIQPHEWPANKEQEYVYKLGTICTLITSEVSEAFEAVRHSDWDNFKEELADVLIRVLDCSSGLGIDMDEEVYKKLEKNKTRGFRHGGKAA